MAGRALIPDFGWLRAYDLAAGTRDIIAGLILAILLVPQAMAYAQLAGLPPESGLFAALLPPVLYLVFGTSMFVSMGPVALVSLVVAEAVADHDPVQAAMIVGLQAGLLLLLLGALGLGRIVNFISEPVLLGFTAAAAFLIATSQLPTLLGIEADRAGDLPGALSALFGGMGGLQPVTAVIGAAALVILLLANRFAGPVLWKMGVHPPYRQALAKSLPLIVIIGCALVAQAVPAGVPKVQSVETGLPALALPSLDPDLWLDLLPGSIAVALIVFVLATAVAKSLAGTDRRHLDTSREAVAIGAGNIAAALTGGYAVGASLSRSALLEDSGARSRLASVVGSAVVLLVLLLLAPLLAYLPRTALAALVISAVFGLVKVRAIGEVWRHDRLEGAIVAIAFLATLFLGVRMGLAIGAGAGLAHFLWFSSMPRVTRIGTDDGGISFRSVRRDEVEIDTLPALVVRVDRSLYFANAAYCEDEIFARLGNHEGVECLILDMRAVNAVDASGSAMLRRLAEKLRFDGVTVRIAAAHGPVHEALAPLKSEQVTFHRTVGQALEACGVYRAGETDYGLPTKSS